jgi:hypothetical protein
MTNRLDPRPVVLAAAMVLWARGARAQGAFPPQEDPPRLQARRATGPVVVDGRLDEADWAMAPSADRFRQIEPDQGSPASFDTEVRVLYDAENLYVSARCHDSEGAAGVRVRNLRRDFDFSTDDVFGVSFDTFRDGQNAMVFQTNPWGARRDQEVLDSDLQDVEWDAAWRVRAQRDSAGWTAEMAIPWRTLRYPPHAREWGVNFVRVIRRLNETTGWSPWPRAYTPYRMTYAGLLVGLEPPAPSTNLRLQPYALARHQRDTGITSRFGNFDAGGDIKWAITSNTVMDLTVKTDFAQADADRQVVNLTRFSVLFPEQRPFFLENASLFSAGPENGVRPFFSRRIGLDDQGFPIPLHAGLRLTHRTSRRSAGALFVRQDGSGEFASSTFAVARYVENVGRESRVGALLATRFDEGASTASSVANHVGTFDFLVRPLPHVYVKALVSGSTTSGAKGDGVAASVELMHQSNQVKAGLIEEYVGPGYLAASGFLSLPDVVRTYPGVALDLRPRWKPRFVRGFSFISSADIYHRASDGVFQEAQWFIPLLGAYFSNSGWFLSYISANWQHFDAPFHPLSGVRVEPGDYQYNRLLCSASTDSSRRFALRADFETGPFYDGGSRWLRVSGSASPSPRLALSLDYTLNALRDIGLARADRTVHLVAPALRLAVDPSLQLTVFYQRNSAAELSSWYTRLSWEFRPLSYVYLVYSEGVPLAATAGATAGLARTDRQLILKLTFNKQL